MADKKIEDLLNFQKDIESELAVVEVREMFLEECEERKKEILTQDIEPFMKELIEQDYDEFMEIWKKALQEKGGQASIADVKAKAPANLWLKILEATAAGEKSNHQIDNNSIKNIIKNKLAKDEKERIIS